MRVLVVGAGATGGYFGGRLLEADCDVTFLLRPRRAAQIAKTGLRIASPHGDVSLPLPPVVTASELHGAYDVVLVSCKSYDLAAVMDDFAPAVGPETMILPVLNGMRHIDDLSSRFGAERVLGGLCMISSTLDAAGTIVHLNDVHGVTFGEQDGRLSRRVAMLAELLSRGNFRSNASAEIMHDMWEKWVFIAALAGITTLMRGSIGDILVAGGSDLAIALYDECGAIAERSGFAPRRPAVERSHRFLSAPGSTLTASMFKDVERGGRTEADHVLGDLLERSDRDTGMHPGTQSLLRIAYTHLMTYEARGARERA